MVFETPAGLLKEIYVSESFAKDAEYEGFLSEVSDKDIYTVTDQVMKSVSDTVTPQGIMAVVQKPKWSYDDMAGSDGAALIVVLERLQDPGNMGTIIRTSEGAGVTGILVTSDSVDVFSPKVVRSTMGSLYRVPIIITDDIKKDIDYFKTSKDVKFFATHPAGRADYASCDYTASSAFMIGNEGAGLSKELSNLADVKITIPMRGRLESLNAAMACGILLYEGDRQRRI